ncbi:MAG TPA: C25 family cysteine peptidase [Thiolinea sp.]|nr:C25 family cysteine peptidase [Thiolinea sp.]
MPDSITLEDQDLIRFNGVNGATGEYLFPAVTIAGVANVAQGKPLDPEDVVYISALTDSTGPHYGVVNADPSHLQEAGWGLVINPDMENSQAILQALEPLLKHRERQVMAGRFRRLSYLKARDSFPIDWLARNGAAAGAVDPKIIPYYLLLVGSPEDIPFRFQFTLDVQYAVGRIHFETVDEYAIYAKQIVELETKNTPTKKQAVLFGVKNDGDKATDYSIKYLIDPLYDKLVSKHSPPEGTWTIDCIKEHHAKKNQLVNLLKQNEAPAFVLTASHGMGFPLGDIRQTTDQGALLCSDWPGLHQAIPTDFYFSANDIDPSFKLNGMMLCLFACYSGGVPSRDNFSASTDANAEIISSSDMLSLLPKQLLLAGAAAVITHIDRAWASSFLGNMGTDNTAVFQGVIDKLFEGVPVGHAMSYLNDHYAMMESAMSRLNEQIKEDPFFSCPPAQVAKNYIAKVDARNYLLMGDPATRLNLA